MRHSRSTPGYAASCVSRCLSDSMTHIPTARKRGGILDQTPGARRPGASGTLTIMFVSTTGVNASPNSHRPRITFGVHELVRVIPCGIADPWDSRGFRTDAER